MAQLRSKRTPSGSWKREAGQDLVEFALLLPVLLVLMAGILDFGRLLGVYIDITNVSREGARYASVQPGAMASTITARAVAEAQACGLDDLNATHITVLPATGRTDGTLVTVRVVYPVELLTTSLLGGSTINLRAETSMVMVGG